jgi:hypothetical protein
VNGGAPERFQAGFGQIGRTHKFEAPDLLRDATDQEISAAFREPATLSDMFLIRSERARRSMQHREWIIDLTTALEVSAYEAFARRGKSQGAPAGDPPNFGPKVYLTNKDKRAPDVFDLGGGPRFGDLHQAEYALVCEAWGTRHEVVHNGQLVVRPYDPATSNYHLKQRIPFDATHVGLFREAVWKAFKWLGSI